MKINPGELNKRIYIYQLVVRKDEQGFLLPDNNELFHACYAKINNISGTELIKSNSDFDSVKKRFLIRYSKKCEKITTDMYVLFKNKKYQIKYANNYDEKNEYVEIIGERVDL